MYFRSLYLCSIRSGLSIEDTYQMERASNMRHRVLWGVRDLLENPEA